MNRTILVIDDNVDMCKNISSILKLANYEVVIANSGQLGIELVQQSNPDLILCDIMMPNLDGYGVLHVLSKAPATANIPFIFLTAKSDLKDFRTAMNLGADDFLTKPFDGLELYNIIELRLKKNDLIKTTFENNISDINDFFVKAKQFPGYQKVSDHRLSRKFKKRDFVFMEGAQPNFLYFIVSGEVKTYKSNPDGKELITGLHREGEFIGFLPLLENKANNESAVVLKDAEIYMIPQQDFLTMIYTNKEIARKFISMLSHNLYDTENMRVEIAYKSVRQRVANALIRLNGNHVPGKNTSSISVTRKNISSMVGTTTESLNRTISDFKEEGLLEISGKTLRVLDLQKLEHVRA
jgi:CRP/FNR family transcriptional regulator, polysaccharide utilization system transcription regulator